MRATASKVATVQRGTLAASKTAAAYHEAGHAVATILALLPHRQTARRARRNASSSLSRSTRLCGQQRAVGAAYASAPTSTLSNGLKGASTVLAVPPNVFDDFVKNDQLEAVAVAERAVEAITRSMSWRLTAPLRNAKLALRVVREDPGQLVVLAARLLRRLRKPDNSLASGQATLCRAR